MELHFPRIPRIDHFVLLLVFQDDLLVALESNTNFYVQHGKTKALQLLNIFQGILKVSLKNLLRRKIGRLLHLALQLVHALIHIHALNTCDWLVNKSFIIVSIIGLDVSEIYLYLHSIFILAIFFNLSHHAIKADPMYRPILFLRLAYLKFFCLCTVNILFAKICNKPRVDTF